MCGFFYFNFERNYHVLKSKKKSMYSVEQKYKPKQNGIENGKSHTQFSRDEPCASAHI